MTEFVNILHEHVLLFCDAECKKDGDIARTFTVQHMLVHVSGKSFLCHILARTVQ